MCVIFSGTCSFPGDMPAGLIHEQRGVGSWLHGECDLLEMQLYGCVSACKFEPLSGGIGVQN